MDGSFDLIHLTVESIGSRDANARIDVTEKPPPHEELATARSGGPASSPSSVAR